MEQKAIEKLELLLNDLKINKEKEKKDRIGYFNTDLFYLKYINLIQELENI